MNDIWILFNYNGLCIMLTLLNYRLTFSTINSNTTKDFGYSIISFEKVYIKDYLILGDYIFYFQY